MKLIILCLLVNLTFLTLGAFDVSGNESDLKSAPNVLFIAVDDLRPELGCYGSEFVSSPNIDKFAQSAVVFNRAYCQQAVCNPSRTSLMTGLRPDTIGVTGNHIHFRSNMPDVVTLPQCFKNNGYHAAAIGKLYHGVFPNGSSNTKWDTMGDPESWSEPAVRFGPRYYYTEEGIAAAKETFQRVYKPKNPGPDDWTQKLVFGPATESPDVADDTLYDGKVAMATVQKLGELSKQEKPFFLAVGFIKPHSPYIAPSKYFDLYEDVSIASNQKLPTSAPDFAGHGSGELRRYTDQPNTGPIPDENQKRIRQAYYACTSYIDAQIGHVLDELERLGLNRNTIVCLYGDHGYHLGEHGLWGKTTNYELDTRVPLIVRAPGMLASGKPSNSLVELVDLYPTLLELAGLPVPNDREGASFAQLLNDPAAKTKDFAISQYPRGGGLMGYSMRTATHRLTQWIHRASGEIRSTELYDYKNGLVESHNMAVELRTTVEELSTQLFKQIEFTPSNAASSNAPFGAQTKKIKVACVGDSITFGSGIRDKVNNAYPSLLQKMLGEKYAVANFGFSGATLLKNGHKPYWQKAPYPKSLEFEPDVVIINLGANDAIDQNWKHQSEFADDYAALIESYRFLESQPKIFICEILPIFPNHGRFEECTRNREQMKPLIRSVAESESVKLIDLETPFTELNSFFPDGLHPNEKGALVMAEYIYEEITGHGAPEIELTLSQEFNDENGTSFEENKTGAFEETQTQVGNWNSVIGNVLIDNKHAKSGSQCLQLAGGGDGATVELTISDGIETNGQLTFWAERWTSRAPFSFRIEKQSGGDWSEIYNGDKSVRVGRAFLSQVKIPLGDAAITKLRFKVTSPAGTGILIDDFKIAPAEPQSIRSVKVVPLTLPALVGTQASAIVKLKITTKGTLNPISVTRIVASLADESSGESIKQIRPFFGGNNPDFRWNQPFGIARTPRQGNEHTFNDSQQLAEGDNFVWLGCSLKSAQDVNIDGTIAATIDSITFSNGESKVVGGETSIQRLGVAVRNGGDEGVHTYRIPGLATTNDGTLIGVYDVRRDGGGDLPGNIDVGMSRSTDGGQTWKPMQVIQNMGDDPKWRGDGIGDPTVLVDRETRTIWVSGTWSHGNRSWRGSGPGLEPAETGQWILVKSEDDGVTWSDPINITKQVKKPEWCFLLQGPGKGITLSDGTIVFPAQYQDPPDQKRLPHSTFIYSRDHGETWLVATGAWDDTTESQIIELADGELMLNCRTNRGSKRAVLTTRDMGQTWQQHPTHLKDLIEPGSCMASLINIGRELKWRDLEGFNEEFLLFSNPDSLKGRNHMTIKASKDSGTTWPVEHHLLLDEQGGAGYSCMTMIDQETVGILYEGSQGHMTFQRIKISEILNPPGNQKTKNPSFSTNSTGSPSNVLLKRVKNESSVDHPTFARPFTDHMVLQCEKPIRVWGKALAGSKVELSLGQNLEKNVTTNADGDWLVEFPAQQASFEAITLTATNEAGNSELKNVLFGEVWICAGQSNMEWELRKAFSGKEALAIADDEFLRLHHCPGGARGSGGIYTEHHFSKLWPEDFSNGSWRVASSKSAANFSAVGYFFAQRLREKLNRPVGMINVAVGGTPIESWVSRERLMTDAALANMFNGNWLENPILDEWCKSRAKSNLRAGLSGEIRIPGDEYGPNHSFKPAFMFEAGIKPFSKLSIRGGLWYQGESNADNPARTKIYDACFPLLVEDWRSAFHDENLPVGFVQLPAMGRPNWPVFREYQRRSLKNLENVGMAITIDTGDPKNVHPALKRPVGDRLAQWALVNTYGIDGIPMGPLFESKTTRGDTLILTFDHAGSRLATVDGKEPTHFEVAGDDGIYYSADATLKRTNIHLRSANVKRPKNARYAWQAFPNPFPNLVNSAGLPASPFSTENQIPE